MSPAVSPLAPEGFPVLPGVLGVRLAAGEAGIRSKGRLDVMLAVLDPHTSVAAVFTRSQCPAAPVDWCRQSLEDMAGRARAVICNSGNANAFTGAAGADVTARTAGAVAELLSGESHGDGLPSKVQADSRPAAAAEVMVASTGVIGEPLPLDNLLGVLPSMVGSLEASSAQGWLDAATAIGTTDTFPKGACAPVGKTGANVVGIAKGSGMIAPDMATMLAFVFTDAQAPPGLCQQWLDDSVAHSFNRITVDSDTSTSDTVLLAATGAAGVSATDHEAEFRAALDSVCLNLAHQIVRDGEGATKFVSVTVTGAHNDHDAEAIARSIADSPLVKTALAASDANWGRIVAAVGKSGRKANRDRLSIWIGHEQCASNGAVHPGYSEARAAAHLQGSEIDLRADVGVGQGSATVWTCDLTHGYIDINAGYRT